MSQCTSARGRTSHVRSVGANGRANGRLTLLILFLFISTLRAQTVAGIPRFHKVSEHLYRGAEPTKEGVRELSKLGIVTILDLRTAGEKGKEEEREARALGMHYISLPMHGFRAPSREQVELGLQVMTTPTNWPVFVHCRYGVDRTGTLVACYRIQVEEWPNELARKEAEDIGMHRFERAMRSFILQFQAEP